VEAVGWQKRSAKVLLTADETQGSQVELQVILNNLKEKSENKQPLKENHLQH